MESPVEKDIIREIQTGNLIARENLIGEYRSFIIRSVCHICKSRIEWSDDEASIGLIAFNEAIDRYSPKQGKSFDSFAYMIIRNRLIDEFRKRGKISKIESLNLDGEEFEFSPSEIASSLEAYNKEIIETELSQELMKYDRMLQEYGIQLEELEEYSPKHQDARKQLIQIAKRFCKYPQLWEYLQRTKRLPIKQMLEFAGVSKKTLERNRKYLIALILIFTSEEFFRIRNTVSFTIVGE